MDPSLYRVESYKEIMKHYLVGPQRRGYLSRAAKYLNCQKSYLSRVISAEVQLSLDHAYMLCLFWELTPKDRDFFILLVNRERASQKEYREFIQKEINKLKRELESSSNVLKANVVENYSPNDPLYYSSWHWIAIHFLTACPQYQTISDLSFKTGLSPQLLESTLNIL